MQFNTRLEYLDNCVAGDITSFNTLLSTKVFDTFDRSYELYRDYIKKKQLVDSVSCMVYDTELVMQLKLSQPSGDMVSDNIPKRGITCSQEDDRVDIHIKLMDLINTEYKEGDTYENLAT